MGKKFQILRRFVLIVGAKTETAKLKSKKILIIVVVIIMILIFFKLLKIYLFKINDFLYIYEKSQNMRNTIKKL